MQLRTIQNPQVCNWRTNALALHCAASELDRCAACRRHVRYGVKAEHFTMLTDAVAKTLADLLGDEFEGKQVEAWSALIELLHSVVLAVYHPSVVPSWAAPAVHADYRVNQGCEQLCS